MQNFTFRNPTKILFGKGQIAAIREEIPASARVLITYGGGSIKRNGVYDQVMTALSGRTVAEFSGIEPNPRYETCMRAVETIRSEGYDYLLAVGGGSVLDGTKFIAAAVNFEGEPWDIPSKNAKVSGALPLATILTLPATGSESNPFAVVSRESTQEKLAFNSDFVYPQFAVLDPETTFSLPARQVSNGIVDAFAHTLEQYLTYPADAPLQDRFAEGILLTLIEEGPKTLANPSGYEARANFMWAATMALNGLIGQGVPQDWTTHMIGHEITALRGLDHAQTLAIVFPGTMAELRAGKREKLLQYAGRVWGIGSGPDDQRIDAAIVKTREFFESLGVPTRLSAYGIGRDVIESVEKRFADRGWTGLGERGNVGPKEAAAILAHSA